MTLPDKNRDDSHDEYNNEEYNEGRFVCHNHFPSPTDKENTNPYLSEDTYNYETRKGDIAGDTSKKNQSNIYKYKPTKTKEDKWMTLVLWSIGLILLVIVSLISKKPNLINTFFKRSPYTVVQQGILPYDKSLTIKKAFNNYDYIRNTSWKHGEDSKGRMLIAFQGEVYAEDYSCKFIFNKRLEYTVIFTVSGDKKNFVLSDIQVGGVPLTGDETIRAIYDNRESSQLRHLFERIHTFKM